MKKENFSFELIDTLTPDVVIQEAIKQIEEATDGYVRGNIQPYEGPIQDYKERAGWVVALNTLQASKEVEVSIQNDLGELECESHKYEVYLSAKELKNYKYRIMFIEYGTVSYPVQIVLNDDIANECLGKFKNIFQVETMADLEELINKILESEVVIKLLQSIIYESLRKQRKLE